ncbi:tRNA pseudouridine(38-40) synthase TruA [Terriglobus sp. RCC_193]|uniref:tRNA pseudouridine(38-40) synthase TruA n=1 Tax=Terriglobus sp. RCC_193 TaxID=3239218 RepID=UPI003523FF15
MSDPTPQPEAATHTFRLTLAYDGTDFFGWQIQPERRTIQGTLARVIRETIGEETLPQGSGRTDTGVHAFGQTVSLTLTADVPADRLHRALNRRLPSAIRILTCEAAPGFHARAGVLNKTYEYRVFPRRTPGSREERICLPHIARFAWDCRWPLQLEPMQQAATALIGTHDFSSFAARDPDRTRRAEESGEPLNNIRTIFASEWLQQDNLLIYRVTGTGFLHHMVRNIVGTCVEIGASRIPADSISAILAAKQRGAAGVTAPPQGLHMMQVVYRDHPTTEGATT